MSTPNQSKNKSMASLHSEDSEDSEANEGLSNNVDTSDVLESLPAFPKSRRWSTFHTPQSMSKSMCSLYSEDSGDNEGLPNNVSTLAELACLPDKFLSNDNKRPAKFKYTINADTKYESHVDLKYALKPLWYSAMFILSYQTLEAMAYYGISKTETRFLLGFYNIESWGPNLSAAPASTLTSVTQGLAWSSPLIGGVIADGFLGGFKTIIMAVACLYLPGLLILALTTFPGLLGSDFNYDALNAALLGLIPIGRGINKACMNAFGAKQFHPILQSAMLEQYFVFLYVSVSMGSLLGTTVISVIAQTNIEVAYVTPVFSLLTGLIVFVSFSSRYVKTPPQTATIKKTVKLVGKKIICRSLDASKKSNGGTQSDSFVDGVERLLSVVPVAFLVLPFYIAFASSFSVTVVQGSAMEAFGYMDAAVVQSFTSIFVLIFGYIIGNILYPFLGRRDINISTTHKFACGTMFGAFFLGYTLFLDGLMKDSYFNNDGSQLSILYQIPSYMLLAIGEVFAVSASYEIAFAIAPKEQKVLCSGLNLTFTTGLANFICTGLLLVFKAWFPQDSTTEEYVNSKMGLYFLVLLGVQVFGIIINVIPFVRNWVDKLREDASDAEVNAAMVSEDEDKRGQFLSYRAVRKSMNKGHAIIH
jgi:POT family proton-dependent oligopeptide transporter